MSEANSGTRTVLDVYVETKVDEARKYLAGIPADAPEQIAALQAEVADLKEELDQHVKDARGDARYHLFLDKQMRRMLNALPGTGEEEENARTVLKALTVDGMKLVHKDHASVKADLAAARAEIAELKGMTKFARTHEAAKQSFEYWKETAHLSEEEEKITKAELAAALDEVTALRALAEDTGHAEAANAIAVLMGQREEAQEETATLQTEVKMLRRHLRKAASKVNRQAHQLKHLNFRLSFDPHKEVKTARRERGDAIRQRNTAREKAGKLMEALDLAKRSFSRLILSLPIGSLERGVAHDAWERAVKTTEAYRKAGS